MDMAMAATPTSTHISRNYYSSIHPKNLFMLTTPLLHTHQTTSSIRLSLVKASKPETGRAEEEEEEINSNATGKPTFLPQEDLNYLMKLGGGSVAGAAAIKYGSIIFPEITRPNIGQAFIMITAPVLVAVLLLIKQSRPQ